ncbi:MAG TPA: rhodanese-like domain-containing protein [Methanomassiliicoccales archaeon]|nr:rhodanese-like domain-containing protein [Methanomassiliicoccales archaeon]
MRWAGASWLQDHLDDGMVILDCQPNLHDFINAHIPGAVYADELVLRVSRGGRPAQYLPERAMGEVLGSLGVRNDWPVLVYGGTGSLRKGGDGAEQAMWAYSLLRFGHDDVILLDGGLDGWLAQALPVTKAFNEIGVASFRTTLRDGCNITMDEVQGMIGNDDCVLVDVRNPVLYSTQAHWPRPGHIPGAISMHWHRLMDPEDVRRLRPLDETMAVLQDAGISPEKEVVLYCGSGREAAGPYLVLKHLLHYPDVRVYEGSFTEWASYPDNRTVNGHEP